MRLRTPCGSSGTRRLLERVLALGADQAARSCAASRQQRGAARQPAVVGDHAEARNEADLCIRHLGAQSAARELAQRLDQAQEAAGGAGLADRQLAARGVVRKTAVGGQRVRADEVRRPRPCRRSRDPRSASCRSRGSRRRSARNRRPRPPRPPWRRARRRPSPSRRDTGSGPRERRCAARWWRAGAPPAGPASAPTSSRQTRKASAPAQGITQSKRWIGSEMARADRYSSSVSGFFISACGKLSALSRWATQILPKSSRVAP